MSQIFIFVGLTEEQVMCRAMTFMEMVLLLPGSFPNMRTRIGEAHETRPGKWNMTIVFTDCNQGAPLIPIFIAAISLADLNTDTIYFTPN